ncbi:MAG: DUF2069 domain-containing protein [Halofilum sp. (in: g-proteobacteria)]|nr:DUF2069 domain-containing protein [Halofilum sp. (in: g-proteobacteria)]
MNTSSRAWWTLTLAGYFVLLGLLLNWLTWIAPPERFPVSLALILLTVPLLFPLRGLLHGRSYTCAWTSFLALFYFAFGIDAVAAAQDPGWLGWTAIAASVALFTGCVGYVRTRGRERRARAAAEAGPDSGRSD